MAKVYVDAVNKDPGRTDQSSVIPGREAEMVPNRGGGWSFMLTPLQVAERFMILGTASGSFYASAKELTSENVDLVKKAIQADPKGVLDMMLDINLNNRAAKVDPSLLVYSMLLSDPRISAEAYLHFNNVIRIGTHLFVLAEYLKAQKAFGARARRAFSKWYTERKPDNLARQVTKYQRRNGWSHADVLSLSHPNPTGLLPQTQSVLRWASGKPLTEHSVTRRNNPDVVEVRPDLTSELPDIIVGYNKALAAETEQEIIEIITTHGLEREHVPTKWLNYKNVWRALGFNMKINAIIRNLNKMTKVGLFDDGELVTYIGNRITDAALLRAERVHPLSVLVAAKVYASGQGITGSLTWTPVPAIVRALDDAFYASFGAVVPINKPVTMAMDISGSMWSMSRLFTFDDDGKQIFLPMYAGEAQAAIALMYARTEPNVRFGVFETQYHEVQIDKTWSLQKATKFLYDMEMGGTDCAQPFLHAMYEKQDVDAFIITTDGESWAGRPHPSTAFANYKSEMHKPDTRCAFVAMTSTGYGLSDPKDETMMNVVGFDGNMFKFISDFARGEL
jgi:60 kDa SS-A/Ro ribonucleoprotein